MSPEHKSDETVLPSSRFNIFRRALFTAPGLRLHRSLYLAGGSHSLANDIGHYVLSVGALQFSPNKEEVAVGNPPDSALATL